MKNKKILIILIAALILLIGGAGFLYKRLGSVMAPDQLAVKEETSTPEDSTDQEDSQPVQAPDFTVYDAEGNEVYLSDYFGKPIVLNFWASWCGPCQMEMPDFHEKYLEIGEDVQFLLINMTDGQRETLNTATEFLEEHEYTFPVLFDTESEAAMTYGAYSLPMTFFIDAEGNAIAQATGAINMATLERGIEMIWTSEE